MQSGQLPFLGSSRRG